MWSTKKPEPETQPEPAAPARISVARPQEKSAIHPVKPTLEAKSMSAETARTPIAMPTGTAARLGASLRVKGEISGNEDLHVDGAVEGLIQLDDRKLTVGMSARLTADVVAREIVVYGSVKGNLRARDRIEIKKDGSVVGDLTTARIMIEDGAYFKGAIEIDRNALESSSDYSQPAYSSRVLPAPVGTAD
jgi:cytoskeletal protein CcmA (bactofilin family)